jgi:Golgi nucleoside diphosphatase
MSSELVSALEDIYGIILFFRENTEDEDLFEALDMLIKKIEDFLLVDHEEREYLDFIKELYATAMSNPLTKFLGVYIKDLIPRM